LPGVHDGHKCKTQHGHNYTVEVTIGGEVNPRTGFIIDFWDLDKIVQPVIDQVDHRTLNYVNGLENPTAENIALWFFNKLTASATDKDAGGYVYLHSTLNVRSIRVYETRNCWSDITGD